MKGVRERIRLANESDYTATAMYFLLGQRIYIYGTLCFYGVRIYANTYSSAEPSMFVMSRTPCLLLHLLDYKPFPYLIYISSN
jgi:hypothetical protein